jgi:hypothetical protein
VAYVAAAAVIVAATFVVFGVGSLAFMWSWNLVIPSTFGGPTLDFGAAFALLIVLSVFRVFLMGPVRLNYHDK